MNRFLFFLFFLIFFDSLISNKSLLTLGSNISLLERKVNIYWKQSNVKNVIVRSTDDILKAVELKWTSLSLIEYSLKYKPDPLKKDYQHLSDYSILKVDCINHIVVVPNLTGFSKPLNRQMVLNYLEINETDYYMNDEKFKECELFSLIIDEKAKLVVDDLMVRLSVYKPESSELISEYTCREFISPILVHSIKLVIDYLKSIGDESTLLLSCEKEILGRKFHGPVDYSLMYDIFDIVLTEAKKLDIVSGINQNLLQQHASLEFLSDLFTSKTNLGKRRREEFEEIYKDLKSVSTAGIITTGKQWIFVKIVSNNGSRKVYRSSELSLNLNSNDITIPVSLNSSTSLSVQLRSFTQQVTKLMKMISQLILDQIQEIHLKGNVLQKYHEMYKVNPTTNVLEYQLARAESFYADFPEEENDNGDEFKLET